MNTNRRVTINTSRNILIEYTNEGIIPTSGLAVVGALLGKSDFTKKLNRMDVTSNRSQHQIKNEISFLPTSACSAWEPPIMKRSMKWMMIKSSIKLHLELPGAFLPRKPFANA